MGSAIWLYLWCLRHQTRHSGLVLGGTPITYAFIEQRLGQPERTVQRWASLLRKFGYIEVTYLNYKKMRITVLKSKKFNYKQLSLPAMNGGYEQPEPSAKTGGIEDLIPAKNGGYIPPKMADTDTQNGGFKQSGSMRSNETPEIETTTPAQAPLIPVALWLAFVEMRRKLRKPLTELGSELIRKEVQKLVDHGEDAIQVVEQSIRNDWLDVFPVRKENGNRRKNESHQERRAKSTATAIETVLGRFEETPRNLRRALPPANK